MSQFRIPGRLHEQFMAFMEARNEIADNSGFGDGAWQAFMEDAGLTFCKQAKLSQAAHDCGNDAMHYWLRHRK